MYESRVSSWVFINVSVALRQRSILRRVVEMEEEPSAKRARNETTSPEGESTGGKLKLLYTFKSYVVVSSVGLASDPI